jgi:hypothetical protein
MDKLFRNVKTGEIKPLPPKVAEANKKNWKEVIEAELPAEGKEVKTSQEQPSQEEPTREQLIATYERLTGGKPDGRWSNQKLAQKIEEFKGTK